MSKQDPERPWALTRGTPEHRLWEAAGVAYQGVINLRGGLKANLSELAAYIHVLPTLLI